MSTEETKVVKRVGAELPAIVRGVRRPDYTTKVEVAPTADDLGEPGAPTEGEDTTGNPVEDEVPATPDETASDPVVEDATPAVDPET